MPKDMQASSLRISIGQASSAGRKPVNQDFHGALVPEGRVLAHKGITLALADGISTSQVSHIAAETTVRALLTDYYATPDGWTVRTAAAEVIGATNAWLAAQSDLAGIGEVDRGHVCTLAVLILKGRAAHIFHVGDSRVWRLAGGTLEPLTEDHRATWSGGEVLSRAMGAAARVEVDYRAEELAPGDVFVLTTDGIHEHWNPREVAALLAGAGDLDATAATILEAALAAGSTDNLTLQIARVEALPPGDATGFEAEAAGLPIPEMPSPGVVLDGYTILRALHANQRSHVFLVQDAAGRKCALKIPASETRESPAALRRFVMEEWIARQVSSPHLMGAPSEPATRSGLYVVTDFVEGRSLRQWMADHPGPPLEAVRDIVEQAVRGLRALHRREMLHQDIRPENLMIDAAGTVKIIDYGSVHVAGVREAAPLLDEGPLGTHQYTAPEVLIGAAPEASADLFSLAVIAYEMLTGHLPYGASAGRVTSERDRARLHYRPAVESRRDLPEWMDEALRRALHPYPARRHAALSEFAVALRHPPEGWRPAHRRPLIERDPVRFWQATTVLFALLSLALTIALAH